LDGKPGSRDFLADYAALALLYTYLAEGEQWLAEDEESLAEGERATGSGDSANIVNNGETGGTDQSSERTGDRRAGSSGNGSWLNRAERLLTRMRRFQNPDGRWSESFQTDFRPVAPEFFDQPVPSSISMADFALARFAMISHLQWDATEPDQALVRDFWNLSSIARSGLFHVIESPGTRKWTEVPLNSLWAPANSVRYCFAGSCRPGLPTAGGSGES
ncbi:MAG: hypothetical protein ACOCZ9_03730, partial [Spirochaetota bacterium]